MPRNTLITARKKLVISSDLDVFLNKFTWFREIEEYEVQLLKNWKKKSQIFFLLGMTIASTF